MMLHRHSYGAGPPLLLLHGLFGSGRNWHSIATRLGDRFAVHAVDARNHGRSPQAAGMSYADMADDVRELIEGLGHDRVTLVGHSMGGKTAMLLALTDPALVEQLVVVDIAPVAYPLRFMDLIDAMQAAPLFEMQRRAEVDQWLAKRIPDASLRLFLLQNLSAGDGGLAWRVNLAAIRAALPALMAMPEVPAGARYPGPTCFIRGSESAAVQPEHYAAIHALFPGADIETIAGAGHLPHTEQPAAFLTALEQFLR
jgi:pimeloyl-ACP methyl ester carboxylesterase